MTARTLLSHLSTHFPSSSIKVSTHHEYCRLSRTFSRHCEAQITQAKGPSVPSGTKASTRKSKLVLTGPSYSGLLEAALKALPQDA